MKHRYTPLAAAVLAAFAVPTLPTTVWAQATANTPTLPTVEVHAPAIKNEYQADKSTIGGKGATALRDIPQSVTVVNRAVLEAQGVTSFADALRNVPGITLSAAEGGAIGNNINLRGFSARTDIYRDGLRDRGQYYRDTFNLDAVEVLKGPSSLLFGRGSTGGVINQVSKEPNLKAKNEVSATIGTDNYYRATADFNQPLSATSALRVNLMGQNIGSTRDEISNKDYAVAPSLKFGIGTPTQVTVSALVQHNKDVSDYGLPAVNGRIADVNRDNFYGLTTDNTVQDVASVGVRVEHKINSAMNLRSQTQYSRYETDVRARKPNVGTVSGSTFTALTTTTGSFTTRPLSSLSVQLASVDRDISDQSISHQTDLISQFNTGSLKHTLATGFELDRDTYDNQAKSAGGVAPIVSLINPVYQAITPSAVTKDGNLAQSSATTVAAYFNDTVELNSQWKVVGGLRWDRYQADISNSVNRANTSGNTTIPSAAQTINFVSSRAGIIYQPTETQSYYVSYGTSFNPSLEQLTLTTGQENLAPEKNRSYEVGAKWNFLNGNLSLTSALFQIQKTNARSQTPTGEYELTGDVRVNGFEVGVVGHITNQWQVLAGYTYLDPIVTRASQKDGTEGKMLMNTPKHSATLWTTYNLTPEWEIGGGATYMSNRFSNTTNTIAAGDYTRFDATVAYHQPKYDVRLNMLNLTDRKDFINASGSRGVPDRGRTVLLTTTFRF